MKLGIIIVHYHTPDALMMCVDALQDDILFNGIDTEIVVVDNGSAVEDQIMFQQLPIHYIDSGENLGYAKGINLGVDNTTADVLIFMNADVIVHSGCLTTLIQSLKGRIGAVGPRLYWDPEHSIMLPPIENYTVFDELLRRLSTSNSFFLKWAHYRWRKHAYRHWKATHPIDSYALSGAMLATRRDVWLRVGRFDERYKLYFEENDWLKRLGQQGYLAQYIPDARVHHLYNQSAVNEPKAKKWFAESSEQFKQEHYGKRVWKFIKRIPKQDFIVPDIKQLSVGVPRIELSFPVSPTYPLWVEVSPTPLGFPAGAEVIHDKNLSYWELETTVWNFLMPARYYIQIIDDTGDSLARFSFIKFDNGNDRE